MDNAVWLTIFWTAAGVLGYVLLGYFAILLLLGGRRRKVPDPAGEPPKVSLIIPAHNEEKVLEAKLNNALMIDYPPGLLKIIVASDGSSDRTNEIAASFADRGVRLLAFEARRGKASVLNDAAEAATGDLLCFCDANVMFRPDALAKLVAHLGDEKVGAVTGDVRLASEESDFGQGEGFYYLIEKRLQVAESNVGSLMGVDGGMYVVRKELFRPLPPDTILDDFVLSIQVIRRRRRVVYDPAAVADESGTPAAVQEYRRRVRVSAGAVQSLKRGQWPRLTQPVVLWQYLSHKLLRWMGPLWLVMLLVSNAFLWNEGPLYQSTLIAQAAFYLLAALGLVSLRFRATRLGGIPFYFTLSHVAMTVGTVKGLFNRQKVTWQQAERPGTAPKQENAAVN